RYQDITSFTKDLNNLSFEENTAANTAESPVLPLIISEEPEAHIENSETPETIAAATLVENTETTQNILLPENQKPKEKSPILADSRKSLFLRLWPFGVGAALLFLLGILLGGPASQALASTKLFQAALTQQASFQNIFATRTPGNSTQPAVITESPANPIQGIADGTRKKRSQDSMVMVIIPSGTFIMGTDPKIAMAYCRQINNDCQENWFTDEEPVHKIDLDTFWIDQTEVTNSQYGGCVEAGVCAPPSNKSSVSRPEYFGNSEYSDYPVVNVDWNKANTYCSWAGARLPSEAEWEKAARGTDGRSYPWGEGIDPTLANINSKDTTRVGSFLGGISPYGVYDMAGNVWEWTSDWYDVYPGGKISSSTDFGTIFRVVRGGSWYGSFNDSRASNRDRGEITNAFSDLGFRCAMSSK
ncbi:MAG: formylglycine-generating enzyme family protein, partial [Chloroflexota bacterium]